MNNKRFDFTDEGAAVIVPGQGKKLRVAKRPLGNLEDMKSKSGKFNPWRLVFNFEMEDEDNPGTFIHEFESPIELRIRYTRGDLQKAEKAGKQLRIGFWDGSDWVVFSEDKHLLKQVEDSDSQSGGELVVQLSSWSDPPIGIGK